MSGCGPGRRATAVSGLMRPRARWLSTTAQPSPWTVPRCDQRARHTTGARRLPATPTSHAGGPDQGSQAPCPGDCVAGERAARPRFVRRFARRSQGPVVDRQAPVTGRVRVPLSFGAGHRPAQQVPARGSAAGLLKAGSRRSADRCEISWRSSSFGRPASRHRRRCREASLSESPLRPARTAMA